MKQQFGYARGGVLHSQAYVEELSPFSEIAVWWMYVYRLCQEYHINLLSARAHDWRDSRFITCAIAFVVDEDEDTLAFLKRQLETYDATWEQFQAMQLVGLLEKARAG